jgi:DNA primase
MNALGKTLGAAYSPRALPNQSMSMPVSWEELPNIYPEDFVMRDAASWLGARGDAWAGMLEKKVDLTNL